MQLKASYFDGSQRVINVTPDFLSTEETRGNHGKSVSISYEEKCRDIAFDLGARPFEIRLMEGTRVIYEYQMSINKPISKSEEPHKISTEANIDQKTVNKLKKDTFSYRWRPGHDGLSWERGIQMLKTIVVYE